MVAGREFSWPAERKGFVGVSTFQGLQSRFRGKLLIVRMACPLNGTALLREGSSASSEQRMLVTAKNAISQPVDFTTNRLLSKARERRLD